MQVPKVRMPPRHKSSNNLLETTNEVPVSTFKQRKQQKDSIRNKPLLPLNMQEGMPATPTAKQSSPLVFRHESHFGRKKKRQVSKPRVLKQADKPLKDLKPIKGHPAKQELVDKSKTEEIKHLTRDFRVHIPAMDQIKEVDAEGIPSKAKGDCKSSSSSAKSSVSLESLDKSVGQSSQLEIGYHNFHRLNLNSEPNSMHDNSFEEEDERKNAKTVGSEGNEDELPQEFIS